MGIVTSHDWQDFLQFVSIHSGLISQWPAAAQAGHVGSESSQGDSVGLFLMLQSLNGELEVPGQ